MTILDQASPALAALLEQSATLHQHLCPRQVLGTRIGIYAGTLFGLALPQTDKRLVAFIETDGCFADGVSVATGCWLGRRTMRLVDLGKIAVTFVDNHTERAIRLRPSVHAREVAPRYSANAQSRWHTYLAAYQVMPDDELLVATPVTLTLSLKALISRNGVRAVCDHCSEEIINEREVVRVGRTLCRSCADGAYYAPMASVNH